MSSLFNQFTTASSLTFNARIGMMLTRHAMYLRDLPDGHANKTPEALALAVRILGSGPSSNEYTAKMSRLVAADVSLIDKVSNDVSGSEVTDADLESAIPTHFLKLA